MNNIEQSGLAMTLQERATELNNLALRAKASSLDAFLIKQAIDIIDNKRYSYLFELQKRLSPTCAPYEKGSED